MIEINEIVKTRSAKVIDLSSELFELLAEVMNEVHDSSYSLRFYKIFLEDHVRAVINHKERLDKGDDLEISPHVLSLNISLSSLSIRLRDYLVQFAKYFMTFGNFSKRQDILNNYSDVTIGFSDLQQVPSQNECHELPSFNPIFLVAGETEKRKNVHNIADRYDEPFIRNVIRSLPALAIEHFRNVYEKIKLIEPGGKTFHAQVLRFSVYDSLFIAKYVEHGSKLIWYQEGAECAELQSKYSRYYQYSVADEYRTWGWKEKEKDIPWNAYPLLDFRSEYSAYENEDIYDLFMCFPKINEENKDFYRSTMDYLLENLNVKGRYQILARPYPVSPRKSNKKELDFIDDNLVTKSSGLNPIAEEISKSKLILQLEIPSTNFLECIFVNHPTVGLLLNEQATELIKPYYQFFLDRGVMHQDVQSLVEFINQTDINEWWKKTMNEPTMQEFKNKFTGGG